MKRQTHCAKRPVAPVGGAVAQAAAWVEYWRNLPGHTCRNIKLAEWNVRLLTPKPEP